MGTIGIEPVSLCPLLQGETVSLRLPCAPLKSVNLALGCMYFNDGSQKTLAACTVWIALMLAARIPENQPDLTHPNVVALAASLLKIRTVLKGSSIHQDELDSAVARIVKQNVDAKVQPVSSLNWAAILKQLGDDAKDFDAAMVRYNSHPEVVAFESSGGSGTISLDPKKKQDWVTTNRILENLKTTQIHATDLYGGFISKLLYIYIQCFNVSFLMNNNQCVWNWRSVFACVFLAGREEFDREHLPSCF